MKPVLRIAMIGSGAMGRCHSAAVSALKYCYADLPFDVRLHTLVTRDAATAKEKADALGFEHTAATLEEALADKDVDIVDVCTPNICHYEEVKKAIASGRHVLCEKPLGISAAEADELTFLAEKSGKCCGIVFNNRHLPAVLKAKELTESGRLGEIISFRAAYLHSSSTDPNKPRGWKQDKTVCGGGVLFDLGSHAIDLIACLLGKENRVTSVRGTSQIFYKTRTGADGKPWQTNADEAFYMTAVTAGGAVGTFELSKIYTGANDDFSVSVCGTRGSLRFDLMQPNYLYYYDASRSDGAFGGERGFTAIECVNRYGELSDGARSVFPGIRAPIGWFRGHVHGMYAYLNAVYKGQTPSPSFADGAYVNRVMEAAYRSDETRTEITL